MFGTIVSLLAGPMVDSIIQPFTGLAEKYLAKQITLEELKAKSRDLLVSSAKEVEISHAETLAKTYESFTKVLSGNPVLQAGWCLVVVSQVVVLVWHQLGIPFIVYWTGNSYPSSGTTVEWAYLLLGGCLGLGPVVLRSGPGKLK